MMIETTLPRKMYMGMSKSGKSYNFWGAKGGKHYFSIPAKSVYQFENFIQNGDVEQCKITFDEWAITKHPSGNNTKRVLDMLEKCMDEFITIKYVL